MSYPRKNLIYLKQIYTFQSNQIKFENLRSSLPLKRVIVHFLTTLNRRKPKVKYLSYLDYSYFYNYKSSPCILRQHRVLRNYRKNKDIVIAKPDKGHGVVILDRKLYNNTFKEVISDTSKFQKLSEYPTLKCVASPQRFFLYFETKKLF